VVKLLIQDIRVDLITAMRYAKQYNEEEILKILKEKLNNNI